MTDVIDRDRTEESNDISRRGFAALSVAAGLAVAGAAEADVEVIEEDVNVKTPDGVADAVLHYPKGKKSPAVLVWTDIFGLRPVFRDMGRRLASSGYTVLTPNPFYRIGHAPQPTEKPDFSTADGRAKVGALLAALTVEGVNRDAIAYIDFLDGHHATNRRAKAGVVGYCMGGPFVFRTAATRSDRIGAGVTCHGGNLVSDTPDSPHLLISKIKAPFYCAVAANDDMRQPDAKDKLRAAFAAANVPATVVVYEGCNHGWCVADGAVYNKEGAERAWGELLKLYGAQLHA
ncbi:MAG TPA: dienelactone hydrolase family protein [Caulobacteraceae bacterium]|nr:dienelactone hydrolase family protein [Caulobacteraceae bacterium]